MTQRPSSHLTFDEFDALLTGGASSTAERHLATCADCAASLEAQRDIVARLDALPFFSPSEQFGDQVLQQVVIPDPFALRSLEGARARLLGNRQALAAAASVILTAGVAMLASILWSLSHPEVIAAAGHWITGEASQLLWLGLRGGFQNVVEQPWYGLAGTALGSPGRLAGLSAAGMVIYVAGLFTLRRLMALPTVGVAHVAA